MGDTAKTKEWHRKHTVQYMNSQREYMKQRRFEAKEKVDALFPRMCFLCNRTDGQLEMHDVKNEDHPRHGLQALQYYLSHPNDFVRLCARCHRIVTWLHEKFGKSWIEILEFLGRGE